MFSEIVFRFVVRIVCQWYDKFKNSFKIVFGARLYTLSVLLEGVHLVST